MGWKVSARSGYQVAYWLHAVDDIVKLPKYQIETVPMYDRRKTIAEYQDVIPKLTANMSDFDEGDVYHQRWRIYNQSGLGEGILNHYLETLEKTYPVKPFMLVIRPLLSPAKISALHRKNIQSAMYVLVEDDV